MPATTTPFTARKSTRRWPQFSLRFLFVGVAGLCVWLALVLHHARQQQESVAKIEAAHGRVMYDYQRNGGGKFNVNSTSSYPTWLTSGIGRHVWHSVVFVDLDSERVTDDTLTALAGCRDLEVLHVSNTSITDNGLAALQALPRLRVLTVNTANISDDGITHIARIPTLEELQLHNAQITDVGAAKLHKAHSLRRLWLDETHVSEQGIERLREALPNCEIDD